MTFHHPLPTLGRKLVNDFFHLGQFLKPLPLLTLLDLTSALGPINHTLLETLSLALCCMYVKIVASTDLNLNGRLTLSNCKTLGKLFKTSKPQFSHL